MRDTRIETRRNVLLGLGALGFGVLAGPDAAAQASGTVLTVSPAPGAGRVEFSDADLAALPTVTFATTTIWTEGVVEFSGPSLSEVLRAAELGPDVERLRLTALNDYSVELEMSRVEAEVPIVANRMDGQPFSVRDKGPLWLVFPYDSAPRYKSESIFAVSIWQLSKIEAA